MYTLIKDGVSVIRLSDGAIVPFALGNRDYAEYEEWRAAGNTPQPVDPPAPEELRGAFKAQRKILVDAIKVTVGTKVFDGDEISQGRMARAAVAMTDSETVLWVLADNTPTQCTKAELVEALRLAGEEQTKIWVMPEVG